MEGPVVRGVHRTRGFRDTRVTQIPRPCREDAPGGDRGESVVKPPAGSELSVPTGKTRFGTHPVPLFFLSLNGVESLSVCRYCRDVGPFDVCLGSFFSTLRDLWVLPKVFPDTVHTS